MSAADPRPSVAPGVAKPRLRDQLSVSDERSRPRPSCWRRAGECERAAEARLAAPGARAAEGPLRSSAESAQHFPRLTDWRAGLSEGFGLDSHGRAGRG